MIVTSHAKGWKIINQRSHGLLAAMIGYQYDIDLPNDIIVPTLIAIAEHDDGVAETLENKNLTKAGAPRHFLVDDESKKTDLKQYLNVMESATSKSQLNALLTSLHLDFICGDATDGQDQNLKTFLKEQEKNRKDIFKHLNINENICIVCTALWNGVMLFHFLFAWTKYSPKDVKWKCPKALMVI